MCKDILKSSALLYISSQFNDEMIEFRRISKLNARKNLNQDLEKSDGKPGVKIQETAKVILSFN